MESLTLFFCENAQCAHLIIFFLLMLAGLNLPISEDILLLAGGMIASTYTPEHTFRLFIWIYFACIFSAWEAYWLGRLFGPKLFKMRWFKRILTEERVEKLSLFYQKYGILTFLVGRYIPGGVRNALFMSSGLTRMPFLTFVLRDGFACFLSTSVLFSLGYVFAENWEGILHFFHTYHLMASGLMGFICVLLWGFFTYKKMKTAKV